MEINSRVVMENLHFMCEKKDQSWDYSSIESVISSHEYTIFALCPSWITVTTAMAAAARFFVRGARSKLPISGVVPGPRSSFAAALLKLSPGSSSRTQRRHAAHFTFQADPEPTQYGEWLVSRLTIASVNS